MTYKFKLSRRLAMAQITAMLASLMLLLACSSSDLTDSSASSPDAPPALTDIFVSPRTIVLEPNQPFAIASLRRVSADADMEYTVSGGTITEDGVFSATESGTYKVAGKGRGKGRRDTTVVIVTPTSPTLADLAVSPDPTSLRSTQSHIFTAKGLLADGSVVETAVTWEATGGSIDAGGLYTAGSSSGEYRVVAKSVSATLADTALVSIQTTESPEEPPPPPPPPTVTAVTLTPATATLDVGQTRQFTATAQLSDGTTAPATVTFAATGGTISSSGLYTAGGTAGSYRVIATGTGGADTAAITITAPAPPPPPSTGQTFFLATAESGNTTPWSWLTAIPGNPVPTASTARARHGSWAYKYEVTNATLNPHSSHTLSGQPQVSMGSPNGRYLSGYYSFWVYIDAGYTDDDWTMLLGWMTGKNGAPDPISHTELRLWRGVLQVSYVLKNCSVGLYPCPNIPGYENAGNQGGYYFMTPQSPAGVKPFPRNQWVHLSMYYKMAPSNGQVKIWQDGTLIMDLTAPTMNTFGGHALDPLRNSAGDMMLQFGIYGGPKADGVQRLYADDFMVTDFRPTP